MKILELTNFSAGICGVWQRVKQESLLLAKKGHEVKIFSSNAVKNSNEIANNEEKIGIVEIKRFPFKKLGGESFMSWNFENEALKFQPDLIIAHSYRHLHTTKALKLAKKLKETKKNVKVFLVTHAPFERNRGLIQNFIVWIYDNFIGKIILNKFDKIIAITKWEIPYLEKLMVNKENIVYIPNGLQDEFFTQKKSKEENKILFLGRISPIKNLEVIINAFEKIEDKKIMLEILGPGEESYLNYLKKLIDDLKLNNMVIFSNPIYDLKEKIKKIDSCKIFVLPSKSEGMPQSLIEAMARKKIVIASNNTGNMDLIENEKNGYLFKNNNQNELAEKINYVLSEKNKIELNKIKIMAKKSSKRFLWNDLINDLNKLILK